MKRAPVALALFLVVAFSIVSCRTAQQARRTQSAAKPTAVNSASALGSDSLLMVERKLLDVIDSLSNLVESDHSRIRSLEQEVSALRARMEGRMLPTSAGQTYSVQPQANTSSVTGPMSEQPSRPSSPSYASPNAPVYAPQNVQDRYAAALRLFNENNFTSALQAFQQLQQEDPNGQYAVNYRYWEGESLYALKRYDEARGVFSDVVGNNPTSSKADDAAFKLAESYEHLGQTADARAAYQRVIADYPKSEYRVRAEAQIRKLH